MQNIDDFTGGNIFIYDEDNNTLYKKDGKYYIVNDEIKKDKLRNIEGYRYFFHKKMRIPIVLLLAIIFVGFPVAAIFYYLNLVTYDGRGIPFLVGVVVYFFSLWIYNNKINNILEDCVILENSTKIKSLEIEKSNIIKSEEKSFIEQVKFNTSGINRFHVVGFLLIGLPFILVVISIIIQSF